MVVAPGPVVRLVSVLILGLASGLPLALSGAALQAWLGQQGFRAEQLGFFALVGAPYTFKFLWAPLMDRFEPPFLGRRRGWLVLCQALVAAGCLGLALGPSASVAWIAACTLLLTFASASQDIVVDAWRTDVLEPAQRGIGGSLAVLGYRIGMITTGGLALMWADPVSGWWSWPQVFLGISVLYVGIGLYCATLLPSPPGAAPTTGATGEVLGFLSVVVVASGVAAAVVFLVVPGLRTLFPTWTTTADLVGLGVGLAAALPASWWVAGRTGFATLTGSLRAYFAQRGAGAMLALLVLYKLGDSMASVLVTPFLLQTLGYPQSEVGLVQQVFGLGLTIFGALVGGAVVSAVGLYRSLFGFGLLQAISNLGFWALAAGGAGAWGALSLSVLPVSLDIGLLLAVALENLTTGMGTAAVVALMMALCQQRFSATQYALLSALSAVGRVWVGPVVGVLVAEVGWVQFFLISALAAAPGLLLLVALRRSVIALG